MGDDVVDLVGRDPAVAQGVGHRPRLPAAGRLRGADVERVGGQRAAEDLGDRRRTALPGVRQRLDDDDARPLAEDEPVAGQVERP